MTNEYDSPTSKINDGRWGFGNNFILLPEIRDILDGLILGDGNYSKKSDLSAVFQMTQTYLHKDWLDSILKIFENYGIKTSINFRKGGTRISKGITINAKDAYNIVTLSYRTLLTEYFRWYPKNIKTLPKDLNFESPILLAQWFMGDGNSFAGPTTLDIKLHTNCFTEDEVEFIRDKFKEKLDIYCTIAHWKTQPVLCIQNDNATKFLEKIKHLIIPSYTYKIKEKPNLLVTKECGFCKNSFETKYPVITYYCKDKDCKAQRDSNISKKHYQKTKDPLYTKTNLIPIKCKACGAEFQPFSKNNTYCKNIECKKLRLRIYYQEYNKANIRARDRI